MKTIPVLIYFFIVLALTPALASERFLTLVDDGMPSVNLKVSETAGPITTNAAADFVEYVEKISGANINNVQNPKGTIFIGKEFADEFRVDLSGLKFGGYVIRSKAPNLLIAGNDNEATARGIYGFLTDYLNVHWYGPGLLWEIVPSNKTIRIRNMDVRCNPDFGFRVFGGMMGKDAFEWCRHNRLDADYSSLPYFGMGHNLSNIFPPAKYGEEHPEYYAMMGGRRRVPTLENPASCQPCFSNPEVAEIAAEAARKFYDKNTVRNTFPLGTNDNPAFCTCPECDALDSPRRTSKAGYTNVKTGWRSYSDSYFSFVERVAKKVAVTHPDKFLGCYAYWNVELPPRKIDKLPDNVVVSLTQETSQHFDPVYKAADRANWIEWNEKVSHLVKYDYYGLGWITPRYFPTLAADDLKFIHANGAMGFYSEIFPFYYMQAPQIYMSAQLLWNVDQDPKIILDRYFTDLYGKAAPEMKAFYDVLEQYWTQPRKAYWFQGGKIHQEFGIANAKLIEDAWQHLMKAKRKVSGLELERVLYVESNFRFSYAVVNAFVRVRNLGAMPIRSEEEIAAVIRQIEKTLGEVRVADDTYTEVVSKDPLQNHGYYVGEPFNKKFGGLKNYLKQGLLRTVVRLDKSCLTILPKEDAQIVLDDLRMRLASDSVGREFGLDELLQSSWGK